MMKKRKVRAAAAVVAARATAKIAAQEIAVTTASEINNT